MTKILLMLLVTTITFVATAQDNNWVDIKYPRAGLLGIALKDIATDKDLNDYPGEQIENPEIQSFQSITYLKDYQNKYNGFFTNFFSAKNFSIKTIEIKNLKIRSLTPNDIIKMKPEYKYVYQGISADTLIITVSRKKERNFDYSKALNLVLQSASASLIKPNTAIKIKEWLPLLESIKSESRDSVKYTLKIFSPDVFFKVKVISYQNLINRDWDKHFKYFFNGIGKPCLLKHFDNDIVPPAQKDLRNNANEIETLSKYPDFWGPKDNTNVKVKLGVERDKVSGELALFAYYTEYKISRNGQKQLDNWISVALPYRTDDDGHKFWKIEDLFLYTFYFNNVEKQILLSVNATQTDSKTIQITNWSGETCNRKRETYFKYPEFQITYFR